jgi:hypothetical protein
VPGAIYSIKSDGKLEEMKEQAYSSEDLLQRLLSEHPDILAGDQIDPTNPRRWMLVSREVPIPSEDEGAGRWAADHLFLDQEGIPTFVEVKRSSDSRIRREVVGQMLDYAANAKAYWPVESIQEWLEKTRALQGTDSEQAVRDLIGADADVRSFWQTVKTNLRAGRIRLLFVADEIPPELRRVVEFLNEQMDPAEVLAIEVRQFVGKESKTLVPRVIGQTVAKASAGAAEPGSRWDKDRFLRKLSEDPRAEAEVEAAQKLLEWANIPPRYRWWGSGRVTGTFVVEIDHKGRHYQLFQVSTNGRVALPFDAYSRRPGFESEESRTEFLKRINSFLDEKIPETSIDRYPSLSLAELADDSKLSKFLSTFEWFIEQVKRT